MTKSKAHFINQLCQIRGIAPTSDDAKELARLSVVDLLSLIKAERSAPQDEGTETVSDHESESDHESDHESESDGESESFSRRAGGRY